ncbi:SDR family NAD(P)-dependent oxidoreductase [Cryptosporangium phraense]|uniref:SDR family NAD(P)-dependent oxidoreductase n=1 Tax=Cryptosporangium phraense TaxID=2593070 RepID=A0A545AFS4_9ACTN|nr:SDR family NAD(P)-dependent oxidoreductase [Cryptosporangium phraense]TQS40110.1 SDR family NAD(P)-dependent oxidoreductase [Cryptosporangium phraense]
MKPILIVGAGPGLGLAVARRFGRSGHPVGLISRNGDRHEGYVTALRSAGITAVAVAADVTDPAQTSRAVAAVTEELGPIEVLYCGPGAPDPAARPAPILQATASDLDEAIRAMVRPALDLTGLVLPGMIERGSGTLLYVTGLSAVVPLPMIGALAPASAALRTYALTMNVALAETGVYAGAAVIGGLITGGDIHRAALAAVAAAGGPPPSGAPAADASAPVGGLPTLDPDRIADGIADLAATRDRAEVVFSALG